MNLSRRKFLWAAPAIVAAPSLMKIKPFEILAFKRNHHSFAGIREILRPALEEVFAQHYMNDMFICANFAQTNWDGNFYGSSYKIDAPVQNLLVRA